MTFPWPWPFYPKSMTFPGLGSAFLNSMTVWTLNNSEDTAFMISAHGHRLLVARVDERFAAPIGSFHTMSSPPWRWTKNKASFVYPPAFLHAPANSFPGDWWQTALCYVTLRLLQPCLLLWKDSLTCTRPCLKHISSSAVHVLQTTLCNTPDKLVNRQ